MVKYSVVTEFILGSKVKLKNYQKRNDWKAHEDEIGTIRHTGSPDSVGLNNNDWRIVWEDGKTSSSSRENLILVG